MTAAQVMDLAAVFLNDSAKTSYTYAFQMPFLNVAINEMQEMFELNNVPITNETSAAINVLIGATIVVLPADLIEIQQLWERTKGSSEGFVPVTKLDFLPPLTTLNAYLGVWAWENQQIMFLGALSDREVKIDYIAASIPPIVLSTDVITPFNSISFLSYRTAALCASFQGENSTRAAELNGYAEMSMDRLLGISTKGRQSIPIRHRPFMARYKNR